MHRTLLIVNLVLLIAAGTLLWLWSEEKKATLGLNKQLSAAVAAAPAPSSASTATNDMHEACRNQMAQLSSGLSNSTARLKAAQDQIRELEAQVKTLTTAATTAVAAVPPTEVAAVPSPASVTNTASPKVVRTHVFETLSGSKQKILARNVEFTGVYGRRVAFKELNSPRRMAYDVDELAPEVLASLEIDPAAQKAFHERQEKVWKQVEAAGLAMAAAEEQKWKERRAAQEAARAEAQRRWEEEMRNLEMQNNPNQSPPDSMPPGPYQPQPPVGPTPMNAEPR